MQVVFATGTGVVLTPDGGRWAVVHGQHWPADDPVVLAQPGLFSPDARYGVSFSVQPADLSEAPVEAVTAEPGERRARVRRG